MIWIPRDTSSANKLKASRSGRELISFNVIPRDTLNYFNSVLAFIFFVSNEIPNWFLNTGKIIESTDAVWYPKHNFSASSVPNKSRSILFWRDTDWELEMRVSLNNMIPYDTPDYLNSVLAFTTFQTWHNYQIESIRFKENEPSTIVFMTPWYHAIASSTSPVFPHPAFLFQATHNYHSF